MVLYLTTKRERERERGLGMSLITGTAAIISGFTFQYRQVCS
jgi:hypothetical protein